MDPSSQLPHWDMSVVYPGLDLPGLADPATLARQMGIDIHSTAFWAASLDTIRQDIDRFEKLA